MLVLVLVLLRALLLADRLGAPTPQISAHEFVNFLEARGKFAEDLDTVARTPTPDSEETKYYQQGPQGRRVDDRGDDYDRPWVRAPASLSADSLWWSLVLAAANLLPFAMLFPSVILAERF